jgi:hypothetical protein
VPNWNISRNYKNIWNSTIDSVTTGIFVTHRPRGAKPQVKGAQRPTGHTLSQFRLRHDNYAPKLVYMDIQCPKVCGDQEEWPNSHVDGRLAIHHLQIDSIKLVEAPIDLYIRILTVEYRTHCTLLVVLQL